MPSVAVSLYDPAPAEAAQQPQERLIVNKRELAKQILKCSLPTVNDLIDRYPDFPVMERGSNGVEWKFDAVEVVTFLEERREADRRDAESRADLFKQLTLPGLQDEQHPAGPVSGAQMLAGVKAQLATIELRRQAGSVVDREALAQNLTAVFGRLSRELRAIPDNIERRFNLPSEVPAAVGEWIDDMLTELVPALKQYVTE